MNIQEEKLKYLCVTTIFTTVAVGVFLYNYYSSTKKNTEKKTSKTIIEEKYNISTPNKNMDNDLENVSNFKIISDSENPISLKSAIEDEDPPTDLDGVSSFREECQLFEKNKKKIQQRDIKEKNKGKIKAPSKGIYGNTAIKQDDPIRRLLLENKDK
uniref:Exported protein n=1 Tax=Strongyloides stercoralis TaxID=6248 RepID=A0A0K0DXU2_STRER